MKRGIKILESKEILQLIEIFTFIDLSEMLIEDYVILVQKLDYHL